MAGAIRFQRIIRTKPQATFPGIIETVEQAIDCVQGLPPAMLKLDRWGPVSLALWNAMDCPDDAHLAAADQALCAALAAEGWLSEAPPL